MAELLITESGAALIDAIKQMGGDVTAKDVAAFLGEEKAARVNAVATALQRVGLLSRVETEVLVDGSDKPVVVKFLALSDDALNGNYGVKEAPQPKSAD